MCRVEYDQFYRTFQGKSTVFNSGTICPLRDGRFFGTMEAVQMRSFLLCVVFLLLCWNSVGAQETMKQISELAVKEKKPAIVYLFTKSCGYCAAMDRDVLGAKEVRQELGKSVVFVRVDGQKTPRIARENNLMGYPTTILLDETGKKLIQIPGYIGKKDFKTILSYLGGRHYKKMTFGQYIRVHNNQCQIKWILIN